MTHTQSPLRLTAARCGLLIVDLQEKLVPVVPLGNVVVKQTNRLIQAAEILGIPYAATVQYPEKLGQIVPPLGERIREVESKRDFSAAVCRKAIDRWSAETRDQIVVVGIETHVCVLQTTLDLLHEGFRLFVVAEAVASRHAEDHKIAIRRMVSAGAVLVTAESVLFEWVGTSVHPHFKAISQMIREPL